MSQVTSPVRYPLSSWLVPTGGALLAAGVWLLATVPGPQSVLAEQPQIRDSDSDGLPDHQEWVLGTDPFLADTDADDFTDCQEFALGSDPLSPVDTPASTTAPSIGMTARGEGGTVRVFAAIQLPKRMVQSTVIRFGTLVKRKIGQFDSDYLNSISNVHQLLAPNGGWIQTYDIELPAGLLDESRPITVFGALARPGKTRYFAAAKVDLSMKEGIPLLRREVETKVPGSGVHPGGGGGSIHQPIPDGGDGAVPTEWTAGQVCFQTSQLITVQGGMALRQIVTAQCQESWDTYCESDCSGSVGSTYRTVDIGILIGG